MKKILISALRVSAVAAVINFLLVYLLGGSILATPYVEPGSTATFPPLQFGVTAAIFTIVLSMIGALILGLMVKRIPNRAVRIWTIIGVVFLILYGIFPFVAPDVTPFKGAILVNLLHAVAGFAALYFLPRRAGLVKA